MKLKYKNYTVEILIEKYEFKDIRYLNKCDREWLIVSVIYQNKDHKIVKKDPALRVSELVELREWFFGIYNKKFVSNLKFTENELYFTYDNKNNVLVVELCFNLSLYDTKSTDDECCIIKITPNQKFLQETIDELDKYIVNFPER